MVAWQPEWLLLKMDRKSHTQSFNLTPFAFTF